MDRIAEAKAKRAKMLADAQAIAFYADGVTSREMSDEDRSLVDDLLARAETLAKEVAIMEADEKRKLTIAREMAQLQRPEERQVPPQTPPRMDEDRVMEGRVIPAIARRYSSLKAFRGQNAELHAYRFGVWYAACMGADWALERARQQGIQLTRAATEGTDTAGGFLVPDEFEQTLIDIREQYGVFRTKAKIMPMTRETLSVPRRTGGLTAYFVGEANAGTQSTKAWDQVQLTARKLMCLAKFSTELAEDAIINVADDLANEIGYAFAYKEDLCGFMGTGALTYGGIVGAGPALTNLNGVDEGGGIIVGTGDLPSELALADLAKLVAICPSYAMLRAEWYCNKVVAGHMQRLEVAAGGNTIGSLIQGDRRQMFLSYPVNWVAVMDTGSAVSQVLAIFGDLSMAATMGTRRGTTIAISNSALNAFEQDELVIRGTERMDIVVHDVGTATAAGPIVGLVGKSS